MSSSNFMVTFYSLLLFEDNFNLVFHFFKHNKHSYFIPVSDHSDN